MPSVVLRRLLTCLPTPAVKKLLVFLQLLLRAAAPAAPAVTETSNAGAKAEVPAAGQKTDGSPKKAEEKKEGVQIWIGNLAEKIATEEEIRKHFGGFGQITDVKFKMNKKRTGDLKIFYAFATYTTTEQAKAAVDAMNGQVIAEGTEALQVSFADRQMMEGAVLRGPQDMDGETVAPSNSQRPLGIPDSVSSAGVPVDGRPAGSHQTEAARGFLLGLGQPAAAGSNVDLTPSTSTARRSPSLLTGMAKAVQSIPAAVEGLVSGQGFQAKASVALPLMENEGYASAQSNTPDGERRSREAPAQGSTSPDERAFRRLNEMSSEAPLLYPPDPPSGGMRPPSTTSSDIQNEVRRQLQEMMAARDEETKNLRLQVEILASENQQLQRDRAELSAQMYSREYGVRPRVLDFDSVAAPVPPAELPREQTSPQATAPDPMNVVLTGMAQLQGVIADMASGNKSSTQAEVIKPGITTLPELPPAGPEACLAFSDWLHTTRPALADVSDSSEELWDKVLEESSTWYTRHLKLDAISRLTDRPVPSPAVTQARWTRVSRRIEGMILTAAPPGVRDEISSARVSGLLQVVCRLYVIYSPGGVVSHQPDPRLPANRHVPRHGQG
eukprot:s3493_g3.t1